MDCLADKVHAHARANRRDVIGCKRFDNGFQAFQHFFLCHDDFGMLCADKISNFFCIF